jgi:iron only hydrogenase large subunit-like protein
VQLQSHNEVLSTLDTHKSLDAPWLTQNGTNGTTNGHTHKNGCSEHHAEGKLFIASVSPQARASLAAVFNVSEEEAGNMITQLLSGPSGVKAGGHQGSGFTWVIDTNVVREACLVAAADEVATALSPETSKTPAKPGSEGAIDTKRTHPHISMSWLDMLRREDTSLRSPTPLAPQVTTGPHRHSSQICSQPAL